jgi:hypothetical protein
MICVGWLLCLKKPVRGWAIGEMFEVPSALWVSVLFGSGLLVSSAVVGWVVGRHPGLLPVRLVAWWLQCVVVPLLGCRGWVQRAIIIFLNNTCVLVLIVALGFSRTAAASGIAILGFALGVALRTLSEWNSAWFPPGPGANLATKLRVRLGLALNFLEPPAIALAVGLAIGRSTLPLDGRDTWLMFGKFVVPLLLVAACGEALWLGVGFRSADEQRPASTGRGAPW